MLCFFFAKTVNQKKKIACEFGKWSRYIKRKARN